MVQKLISSGQSWQCNNFDGVRHKNETMQPVKNVESHGCNFMEEVVRGGVLRAKPHQIHEITWIKAKWLHRGWFSMTPCKDKLEDMDVSLIFCHRPKWAMIFIRSLWPNRWANLKSQGAKWKIWTLSFHRYLLVCCRSSGLVTAHCQSWVVFDFF